MASSPPTRNERTDFLNCSWSRQFSATCSFNRLCLLSSTALNQIGYPSIYKSKSEVHIVCISSYLSNFREDNAARNWFFCWKLGRVHLRPLKGNPHLHLTSFELGRYRRKNGKMPDRCSCMSSSAYKSTNRRIHVNWWSRKENMLIFVLMPRHSKNANTRTFNSYYEKKKGTYGLQIGG